MSSRSKRKTVFRWFKMWITRLTRTVSLVIRTITISLSLLLCLSLPSCLSICISPFLSLPLSLFLPPPSLSPPSPPPSRPPGPTFTWWGCFGLCQRHKQTEIAHSFLFCSCVYFCLYGLSTVFHSINPPENSPLTNSVLPVLFLPF